jgi:hypothetical protein
MAACEGIYWAAAVWVATILGSILTLAFQTRGGYLRGLSCSAIFAGLLGIGLSLGYLGWKTAREMQD